LRRNGRGGYTPTVIRTLLRRSDAVRRVKDSRFLASAFPADSEEEAREGIASVTREHPQATHHCHAYRIEAGCEVLERCDDAGEPVGSAGAPILALLKGRELANVVVVVTRYFGGTKLGVGGLARAYREAARAALERGEILEREPLVRISVSVPGPLAGECRALIARLGGALLSEHYGGSALFRVALARDSERELRRMLGDLTRGEVRWDG
jgi:uncharacterized YigZ family protein